MESGLASKVIHANLDVDLNVPINLHSNLDPSLDTNLNFDDSPKRTYKLDHRA